MRFLHATIQRSQKVLMCIPLQGEIQDVCKVLLIYHDYAQVLQVDNRDPPVVISSEACYPLTVPIVWCAIVGSHIAAVTRDGHLMMLESTPPFKRVSMHKMVDDRCPMTVPVAHCAVSNGGECMVTCGFTKRAFVAQFDSEDIPHKLVSVSLPPFFVMGVAATCSDMVFAFLVAVTSGRKFVVLFDIESCEETSRAEVPQDSIMIYSIFDAEGYSKLVLFTETEIRIREDIERLSESGISLESKVHSWFVMNHELFVQCLDTSVYRVSFLSGSPTLVSRGNLPLITTFACLDNDLLFCVSESGDSFFLPMDKDVAESGDSFFLPTDKDVALECLPTTSIPLTPRITAAFFKGRRLIMFSGRGGPTSQYTISSCMNTLPFTLTKDEEASRNVAGLTRPRRLFALPGGILVASANDRAVVVKGSLDIFTEGETLALGMCGGDVIQIHRAGIHKIHEGKQITSGKIKAAAVGDEFCVAAFADHSVVLFDKDLNVVARAQIAGVQAFAFCHNYVAIAFDPEGGGNSTVSLYSHDLSPYNEYVGQLTGRAYSMVFVPTEMELYVSTTSTASGSVSRWIIGDDFSNSCAQIYAGRKCTILCPFGESIILSSEKTCLFNGSQLLAMDIDNVKAICPGHGTDELYVIDHQRNVCVAHIMDPGKDLTPMIGLCDDMPRQMTSIGSRCFVITRSHVGEGFRSFLMEIDDTNPQSQDIRMRLAEFEIAKECGAVSILGTPSEHLFTGFTTASGRGVLMVMGRNGDSLDSTFRVIRQFYLDKPPLALANKGSAVLAGVGRRIIEFRLESGVWTEPVENLFVDMPTQVAFIQVKSPYIWVGDRTDSVFCFHEKHTEKERTNFIARDSEPRNLTAMTVIEPDTVAVGDKFGKITILRLPDEAAESEASSRYRRDSDPRPPIGYLVKISVISVNDVVTSLMVSHHNRKVLFYTTLLGKIGYQIPLDDESEFITLSNAELLTIRRCAQEFGLTVLRTFDQEKLNVVNADVIDLIEQLQPKLQKEIEGAIQMPHNALIGRLCQLKYTAKF